MAMGCIPSTMGSIPISKGGLPIQAVRPTAARLDGTDPDER